MSRPSKACLSNLLRLTGRTNSLSRGKCNALFPLKLLRIVSLFLMNVVGVPSLDLASFLENVSANQDTQANSANSLIKSMTLIYPKSVKILSS